MSGNDRLAEIKARHEYLSQAYPPWSIADPPVTTMIAKDVTYLLTEVERLRAENAALTAERDRLREALIAAENVYAERTGPETPLGFLGPYGPPKCERCRAIGKWDDKHPRGVAIAHEPDCPFVVLNEEPTDA